MFISSSSDFCYKKALFARDLSADSVKSTAESFKSWDTCMDNKTCKIVAIVGIVLAVLFVFWIISTLVRCMCMGFQCLEALCCCCCCGRNTGSRGGQTVIVQSPNQDTPYSNPNMYPPTYAPTFYPNRDASGGTAAPQQAYFTNKQGYESVYTPQNNAGRYDDRPQYTDEHEKYNTSYRGY